MRSSSAGTVCRIHISVEQSGKDMANVGTWHRLDLLFYNTCTKGDKIMTNTDQPIEILPVEDNPGTAVRSNEDFWLTIVKLPPNINR